jgi:hypothetical protein
MKRSSALTLAHAVLLALGLNIGPLLAEEIVVGVVLDFQPHKVDGRPGVMIEHGGDKHRLREHELIYEGDRIIFDRAVDPKKGEVDVLVDSVKTVTIKPDNPTLPERSSFLQSLMPELLVAYRWINPANGSENELRNALSREGAAEVEDLSVLPHTHDHLTISRAGGGPVWIAWKGGLAPFTISLEEKGKSNRQIIVCGDKKITTCARETTFEDVPDGDQPITLTVKSSDGEAWSRSIAREAISWQGSLADTTKLGDLGTFLRATDLLNRDPNRYVLETARELVSIAPNYPPARMLLDRIQAGRLPE